MATVTITLKNSSNVGVPDITPTFTASGTNNTLGNCLPTDASGVSTCTIKTTKAEVKNLSIATPIVKAGDSVTFVAGGASALYSTISATTPATINVAQASTVTVTLKDANNNPIQGQVPTFTLSGTGNTLTSCGTSDATGVSTCYAASSVAETKTLTLTHNSLSVAGNNIVFQAAVAGINLEVPIEMLDQPVANWSGGLTLDYHRSKTNFNPADYVSSSNVYEFEIVVTNQSTADAEQVDLVYDNSGTDVLMASIPVPISTTKKRIRQTFTVTPTHSTSKVYRIKLSPSATAGLLIVHAARIIVRQTNASATKIYIPLINSIYTTTKKTEDTSVRDYLPIVQTKNTTYIIPAEAFYQFPVGGDSTQYYYGPYNFNIWKREDSRYVTIPQSGGWTFEAILAGDSTAATASVALYNKNNGLQVTGSELNHSGGTTLGMYSATLSSNSTNFINGHEYEVRMKSSDSSKFSKLYKAGLWLTVQNLQQVDVYHRIAIADRIGRNGNIGTLRYTDARVLYTHANWSNPLAYLEVTGSNHTDSSSVFSVESNSTNDSGTSSPVNLTGSNVTLTSAEAPNRNRSASFSLTNNFRYIFRLEKTNYSAYTNFNSAFLIIRAKSTP